MEDPEDGAGLKFFCFLQYQGLNSGFPTCLVGARPPALFAFIIFEIGSCIFACAHLNHRPPNYAA
jgi:hypothetical protein